MSVLGRGLDSLISAGTSDEDTTGDSPSGGLLRLSIHEIRPNPGQPRKTFDSGHLEELRDSIRTHGVLQPICVRAAASGYEIVSGERRWRAARLAGLTELPVIVLDGVDDQRLMELALIENLQRQDLDPIEKARGFHELMEGSRLTQEEVAERVGLKRSTVANHLRLLELPEDVQDALVTKLITMGHARALLGLPKGAAVKKVLGKVVRDELSVRLTERLVKDYSGATAAPAAPEAAGTGPAPASRPAWEAEAERRIREHLGVQAELRGNKDYRGQITLRFGDREDLERLLAVLAPKPQL